MGSSVGEEAPISGQEPWWSRCSILHILIEPEEGRRAGGLANGPDKDIVARIVAGSGEVLVRGSIQETCRLISGMEVGMWSRAKVPVIFSLACLP